MNKYILITMILFYTSADLSASCTTVTNQPITAVRKTGPVSIDGTLDEPAWQHSIPVSSFIQRDPIQGAAPTEKTVVRVLYDETALYVGAYMHDSRPDSILSQMGRRDSRLVTDDFTVFLDPYNDERTGFFFTITPSGCISDGTLLNDDWEDDSWDGVWESRAMVCDGGWTAEIRIPYSQLRFHQSNSYVWGINFSRTIQRKNERVFIVYTPKDGSGFVSLFPDLKGIEKIKTARQIEILPYVSAKAEYTHPDAGNPFNDGSVYLPNAGADIKVGIGNNLTLDGTVNPDFGQVEVDPAVVNLSDVETFYSEKRPFFVEGSSIFSFGNGGASSNFGINWSSPDFFYSRRIGRQPQGSISDHDFARRPEGTPIIGAVKLSGKMAGNWNVGTMHAVTGRTMADIENGGIQSRQEIEPLTYYGLVRAQKEFEDSQQGLGIIATTVNRSFDDGMLRAQMNSRSAAFGIDGWAFIGKDKEWVATGWVGMSHVQGSRERMLDLQANPQHYFQRPDAGHVTIDSNATSMSGYAGRFALNKQKGNMLLNAAFGFIHPGFDVNDMGFMQRTDQINGHLVFGNKWINPGRYVRYKELHLSGFSTFNFNGDRTSLGILQLGIVRFLNYWSIDWMGLFNAPAYSHTKTRGGPLMKSPASSYFDVSLSSDSRKRIEGSVGGSAEAGEAVKEWSVHAGLEWKPSPGFFMSVSPRFSKTHDSAQWVGAYEDETAVHTYGTRYVFGELDHTTVSASIRLNWTFTPVLSLQLYAQPLISSGTYTRFKELTQPKTYDFLVYGEDGSTFSSDTFTADPDGPGPARAIELNNADFNIMSLRGNAVLRWEYRPGSTLFFVWTQRRSDFENVGTFRFRRSTNRLLDLKADNIFMIKATYWFTA